MCQNGSIISMNFESPLPKEATAEMNKVFEGVQPIISESQLKEL